MRQKFIDLFWRIIRWSTSPPPIPAPVPVPTPAPLPPPSQPPTPMNPDTMLTWDMVNPLTHANWHNVRVICDLLGLDKIQSKYGLYTLKEELCATVWGESDFLAHAIRHNYAFHTVTDPTTHEQSQERYIASTDNGICQWNDFYHGKEITPDEAQNDPEKAVRLMAQYFLAGRQNQWVAHLNGSYKAHIGKTL